MNTMGYSHCSNCSGSITLSGWIMEAIVVSDVSHIPRTFPRFDNSGDTNEINAFNMVLGSTKFV
jgi:hypothetical protein